MGTNKLVLVHIGSNSCTIIGSWVWKIQRAGEKARTNSQIMQAGATIVPFTFSEMIMGADWDAYSIISIYQPCMMNISHAVLSKAAICASPALIYSDDAQ
jgi:hypothetical protein